jgi:hypothetical protein
MTTEERSKWPSFIVTDFEWAGQVFIPVGDGAPAQRKPMGELTVGEFARYLQGRKEEVDLQTERTRRYCALKRRDGKMTNNILQSLAIAAMIALGPTIATAQMMKGPHVSREVWDQVWASERVYIDCLERGAASLALASNDPVETIVDAAKGLCIDEANALTNLDDDLNIYEDMVSVATRLTEASSS